MVRTDKQGKAKGGGKKDRNAEKAESVSNAKASKRKFDFVNVETDKEKEPKQRRTRKKVEKTINAKDRSEKDSEMLDIDQTREEDSSKNSQAITTSQSEGEKPEKRNSKEKGEISGSEEEPLDYEDNFDQPSNESNSAQKDSICEGELSSGGSTVREKSP